MACANSGSLQNFIFQSCSFLCLSSILCFRWKFWNDIFITVILNGCLLLFISYSKAHSMMEREREKLRPWRITGEHCLFTFCAHEPRRTSKRDTPEPSSKAQTLYFIFLSSTAFFASYIFQRSESSLSFRLSPFAFSTELSANINLYCIGWWNWTSCFVSVREKYSRNYWYRFHHSSYTPFK